MQPSSATLIAQLRAARRSHCNTCGCTRCHRIDQLLGQLGQPFTSHPENTGLWLIEGKLQCDETGVWSVQTGESIQPLSEHLQPWAGYNVTILIGREPAAQEVSPKA